MNLRTLKIKNENKPQHDTSHRPSSTWGLPQGWNINIHLFVGSELGVKNSEAPHINKHGSPLSVLMLFFTHIF
jgi:hypothetical protein